MALSGDHQTITFTPTAGYNGPASFQYTVTDAQNQTSTATVTFTIVGFDDPPVFTSPSAVTFVENGTGVAYATAASDPDSTISYTLAATGDYALFDINSATGAVTFKSAPDFENPQDIGHDNVYNITVAANGGPVVTKDVAITVTDVYEFAANADSGQTNEDTPYVISVASLLANDLGSAIAIQTVHDATHGTVVLSADKTTVTFTPDANYNGPAQFVYDIKDSFGTTAHATVSIAIAAVDDPLVFTGTKSGTVTETGTNDPVGVPTASGNLSFIDIDSPVST